MRRIQDSTARNKPNIIHSRQRAMTTVLRRAHPAPSAPGLGGRVKSECIIAPVLSVLVAGSFHSCPVTNAKVANATRMRYSGSELGNDNLKCRGLHRPGEGLVLTPRPCWRQPDARLSPPRPHVPQGKCSCILVVKFGVPDGNDASGHRPRRKVWRRARPLPY